MLSVEGLLAYGPLGLFIVAFTESTVFPIPPDVMLLPLAMMSPRLSWWYAFLTSSASVLGALVGYAIGRKAGRPLLKRYFREEAIQQVETLFVKYGGWAVGIAAFTPVPFKLFTFGAGIFRVPLLTFTAVSTIGRSARFFFLAAMVYFLGERAQVYLGRKFEIATLVLTGALLLATWLLPKMIPGGKKQRPLAFPSRLKEGCVRAAQSVRGLGARALAWGTAAVILGILTVTFIQDVAGPERAALNGALGWATGWLSPGRPTLAWKVISSPWTLGALAVAGLASHLRLLKQELFGGRPGAAGKGRPICAAGILLGLPAVAAALDLLVRRYLPGVFSPAQVVIPYLLAIGLCLFVYGRAAGWRKLVAPIPGAAAGTAVAARFVADGGIDAACGALSLLCSAFMFCVTMSALSVLFRQTTATPQ